MADMTETKTFHIADILSVTTGRLLSPVGHMYDLLGWMTGEDAVMTHQLPRLADECEGYLRTLFPDLAAIDPSGVKITSEAEANAYTAGLAVEHGETREVPRLPQADHTHIDALAEMGMIAGKRPIIPL